MNEGPREGNVVPLGTEPPAEEPIPPTPPSRLHAFATAGMATCALVGIVAVFLFITVNWTETTRRYVIATAFLSGVGFLAFASAAVITAARDTYANERRRRA